MLKIVKTSNYPLNSQQFDLLYQVVLKGYEMTEEEIWGPNYIRLFEDEFKTVVESGQFFIALYNDKIVGGVHGYLDPNSSDSYKISLLSVDFKYGGQGIGTKLIKRVEEEAISNGIKHIKLEILRAKAVDVPNKIRLANYYKRLGYKHTHSDDASCLIPEWKYKKLLQPANFDFFLKDL